MQVGVQTKRQVRASQNFISIADNRIICTYWLSGRAGRENIWLEVMPYGPSAARSVQMTKSQIFSRPARPNSVNKHFIIWPDFSVIKSAKNLWNTNRNVARGNDQGRTGFYGPAHVNPYGPHHVTFSECFLRSARAGKYGSYDKWQEWQAKNVISQEICFYLYLSCHVIFVIMFVYFTPQELKQDFTKHMMLKHRERPLDVFFWGEGVI